MPTDTTPGPPGERLQKIMARRGYGSRRKAEELIRAGRVQVDGHPATIGERADPSARITVDGTPLDAEDISLTLMLHKPSDVIVAASDNRGRRLVFDLLADVPPGLRHVGRLDRDSEGLLLLTTDGELAHRVAHPRFEVAKTYEALVDGHPGDDTLARLRAGIELDDGPTHSAEAERLHRADGGWWVRLVLHEGRKRQVRRMLAAVGHLVRRLVRTRLGPLELGDLPAGVSRPLTHDELAELRALCGLDAPSVDAADEAFL
ncbi:MAG: pseudouridine synthase [Chloroflexi bacterium]|nr:pseudouridine synthase [Chloroflexota bacterium]